MNERSIEVTYRLSDMFAVNLRAWRRLLKTMAVIELLFVVIIIGLPMLDGLTLTQAFAWADWQIAIYAGLFFFIFLAAVLPLIAYFRVWRQGLLGPNRFSFAENGVSVETPKIQSLIYWSGLTKVIASKDRLYLFLTPASAVILPRRAFDDQATFEQWVDRSKASWAGAKAAAKSE